MGSISQKDSIQSSILNDKIFPLLLKTSIPTIIGMLVMVIYNLTDTFFIGLLKNKSMTASIGIVFSFLSVIQAVGFWFGYGSGNIMSKKIGENKLGESNEISILGIVFSIFIGIVIALFSYIFVLDLAKFIGGDASENLLLYTVRYLKIISFSVPFVLYSITVYNQLRLCGQVKAAMIALMVGMLSNIILDPIFIFTLGIGFIGAAYATLAGQVLSSLFLTILLLKKNKSLFRLKTIRIKKEYIYHILIGGMPNFSRQIITSVSLVCLNIVASKYGEELIAALTISSRIIAVAFFVMIGWAQGFQPICAMNYGAKQFDRVKKAFTITVVIGTVFISISSIVLYFFAQFFLSFMSKDKTVLELGVKLIRMQCITLPFLAYFVSSSMMMQNTGRYFSSLAIATSRQGFFYIPLLFLLSHYYGEFGILILQPISDVLSLILCTIVLFRAFRQMFT